jgi:hypothetical protein
MSNCDFVAGRSLIDLVASRLAHPALALCAVSVSTPDQINQSQRLPRQLTVKDVGPNDVITNHGIERGDDLAHDRNDPVELTSGRETIVHQFEGFLGSPATKVV